MLSGEVTNTTLIVFGLTRPEVEPTIYRTRGEYANYYTTDEAILYNTPLITIYHTIIYKLHVFCLSICLILHNQNEPLNYKVAFLK